MNQPTLDDSTDPTETAFAATLGLSRADLKKMRRELLLPHEWAGGDGVPITITPEGQKKIRAALESTKEGPILPLGCPDTAPAKKEASGQPRNEQEPASEPDNAWTPIAKAEAKAPEKKEAAPDPDPAPPESQSDEPPTLRVFADLYVVALPLNKQLLLARTEDNKEVRVQVKANALFKAGMKLEHCRKDGPCIYTYQGRMPRRKGKW